MTAIATNDAWMTSRLELLDAEKAFQRARDELAEKRRALPWRKINADYVFEGEFGSRSLSDLFDARSQLVVYHFMYHPDWAEGCKSCSFWADSYDGMIPHLRARDVSFAVISRGPLDKLLAYRDRMDWKFPWLSSADNSFNYDFNVSFTEEQIESKDARYNYRVSDNPGPELPGLSVFAKGDEEQVFHTYSTYARGLDNLNPVYQILDLVPKGRDEDKLPYPMDWVRRHDEY
ncbi:MAG: DUF899 domain-containing protein [Gammaproteobacteria bacterium]|nr:DUF899 domain-containing protein [Gammaproteobacteria bacterium]NNC56744.1 DUF899 domain-containing protein [Woeseiaceae bacterium]NNL49643.1 DUF899 domain-containing protein [Woeseiaceae bacterium]